MAEQRKAPGDLVEYFLDRLSELLDDPSWDEIKFEDDVLGDKARKVSEARGDLHRGREKLRFVVSGKRGWW